MKRLLTSIGIILLLITGVAGGIFYERYSKKFVSQPPLKETKKERKVLYYKCPMGEPDFSDKPGKARCGMDYVPVYEDEAGSALGPGEIYITPEKIQRIGVRSEEAKEKSLKRTIRAVATVDYDERRLFVVNAKIEGWIEKLYVNATGKEVAKGEPLLDIYSPDLVSTQEEYLLALDTRKKLGQNALPEASEGSDRMLDASRRRLKNWDISDEQVRALEESGKPTKTLTLHSPGDGIVIDKSAVQGMKVMPGEKLFTIADMSNVWLFVDFYEYEAPLIKTGQRAKVTVNSYPGETFYAVVSYIYPYLNQETRTARVRLEMPNPPSPPLDKGGTGGVIFKFKPGMYANAEIESVISERAVVVPEDAVIDTGDKQAVILDLGEGRFKVIDVRVGQRGDEAYQILSGVKSGQKVVTSANFFIDSESSIRTAAGSMLGMDHGKKEETVPSPPTPLPAEEGGRRSGEGNKESAQPPNKVEHKGH